MRRKNQQRLQKFRQKQKKLTNFKSTQKNYFKLAMKKTTKSELILCHKLNLLNE